MVADRRYIVDGQAVDTAEPAASFMWIDPPDDTE
jgi:hypothetical protein